jgi:hypothetical protein
MTEVADPGDLASSRIFSGASLPLSARHRTDVRLLVALASGAPASAAATLRGPDREVMSAPNCCPDSRLYDRGVILTISALALLVLRLVVAAPFAIGAPRQLRVIGLLRAAA